MKRLILLGAVLLMLGGCSLWPAKQAAKANAKNVRWLGKEAAQYWDTKKRADGRPLTEDDIKSRMTRLQEAVKLADKMEATGK